MKQEFMAIRIVVDPARYAKCFWIIREWTPEDHVPGRRDEHGPDVFPPILRFPLRPNWPYGEFGLQSVIAVHPIAG